MKAVRSIDYRRLRLRDSELDALIEVLPSPILLGDGSPTEDAERLRGQLQRVFKSSTVVRRALHEMCGYLIAHHDLVFAQEAEYLSRIYSQDPWENFSFPAVCITGLSGIGKTQILKAFLRLVDKTFQGVSARDILGHSNIPFRPVWPVSLENGTSIGSMLIPFLEVKKNTLINNDENERTRCEPKVKAIREQARRRSWLDLTSIIWLDEFQQVSFGSSSNTKAAMLLHQLMAVGPRLIFAANFSLVRALMRRPQQDTHRFLSSPLCIEPAAEGCESSVALLDSYKNAVPNIFAFDSKQAAAVIHRYSYSITRNKVNLLCNAYLVARMDGRQSIELDDLSSAYASRSMIAQRLEVETLFHQDIAQAMIRDDLWNPLGYNKIECGDGMSNVVNLMKSNESFEAKVQDRLLREFLLPEQAAALSRLEVDSKEKLISPATIIKLRRARATKEDLMKGVLSLDNGSIE